MNWSEREESQLVEYLARRICDRASGTADDECIRNYPRDVYFIGNLRPFGDGLSGTDGYLTELMSKLSPVAFGAEFRIGLLKSAPSIDVTLSWSCYYRILPTFEQQVEHQGKRESAGSAAAPQSESPDSGSSESAADTGRRGRARAPKDSAFVRFKKLTCRAVGRVAVLRNAMAPCVLDIADLQSAVDAECRRVELLAATDPNRFRTDGSPDKNVLVPESAITSRSAFETFLASLKTDVNPKWQFEVRVDSRFSPANEHTVAFQFVNMSPKAGTTKESPNVESFLFEPRAKFEYRDCKFLPFELDLAPRGFRYDKNLWGRGLNCAVVHTEGTLVTSPAPTFRQKRYRTRTEPRASFADLATDPLPALNSILGAMEAYQAEWEDARNQYLRNCPDWEATHGSEFDRERGQFTEEISRFREGLQLIENDSIVRLAFKLTNETFRRGPRYEWRLFQIVFLVSEIPSIAGLVNRESRLIGERQLVDIIYFPTGGGKTEAYLGVIVFHCFYDRLRGKTAGTSVWTRFPLRLLTIQQTQRVADVIGMAELVRREQDGNPSLCGKDIDGFSVGYFVGQGGSPNEIADPARARNASAEIQIAWAKANDAEARQEWKRLVRCPSCKSASVRVDFDKKQVRVLHRCTRSGCAFPDGVLPVFIVDNEIYRYLPTVIVGTIDKLAGLGNQRKISQILGLLDGRCVEHGYYKGKCCQKDCNDPQRLRPGRPNGISGPALFVQDELHLLKEGLGTFDGHYETFTQELLREFGNETPLKVIASSATIEAFDRQVEHLYGRSRRQARIFPGPGPTLGNSFYAKTLEVPQRIFVGIIPHNKTIFNTILELIDLCHREIELLLRVGEGSANPYGGELRPGSETWTALLDFYRTTLTYFLAGRELNSIRTDIEGDVNPNLMRDGFQPVNILELTGSTTTDDVQAALEKLEKAADRNSAPDAVLATSMVSHGVDIDRLNAMVFYGMPRQNAEYIQASSRIGRSHIGLVLACFHPARERDQSHYAYFEKFHEFLGQLVEPVAINRWAKFSVDRTLPGLFMGVLLQLLANRTANPDRYYVLDYVKQAISTGSLRADHFIPLLERAYFMGDPPTVAIEEFRGEIRTRVQQFLDQIITAGAGYSFVSDVLIPKPMRSLRDVDEPIDIELDTEGSVWGSKVAQRMRGGNGTTDD